MSWASHLRVQIVALRPIVRTFLELVYVADCFSSEKMAKKVAFLTRPLLILTWAVLLAAQWPIGVQGVILITNSSNVCGPNVLPALCGK